ncbi:ras association domain-containing protein 8 [Amia ocellicauda]|uniref:ras association domain-containing protein 8 n=1 Tax=Amia ocellicauda TaxID=2972642 RepID=UPI003464796A
MELKVWVESVQRVICGVSEKTTCQEVVIALAQAMGRPGRYTLKEKFKEFERNVSPDEKLLESLNKYGQQASEVQLILNHNGPSLAGPRSCAQLRGPRGADQSAHRQSLPPLVRLRIKTDLQSDNKKPKRKSLTFAEEAREWIESFSRTRLHRVRGKNKDNRKRDSTLSQHEEIQEPILLFQKTPDQSVRTAEPISGQDAEEKQMEELHRLLSQQQTQLMALQSQLDTTEAQIEALEEQEQLRQEAEQLEVLIASQQAEAEELEFWENELRAEEGYETDLQEQFLEMKQKASECKGKLEEYKKRLQGLDIARDSQAHLDYELSEELALSRMETSQLEANLAMSKESLREANQELQVGPPPWGKILSDTPKSLPFPYRFSDTSCGPGQLREWLTRWSKAQASGVPNPEEDKQWGSTRV